MVSLYMADIKYRVRAELENIDKIIRDMHVTTKLSSLITLELAGVAALLHSFYNGLENIMRQIIFITEASTAYRRDMA